MNSNLGCRLNGFWFNSAFQTVTSVGRNFVIWSIVKEGCIQKLQIVKDHKIVGSHKTSIQYSWINSLEMCFEIFIIERVSQLDIGPTGVC